MARNSLNPLTNNFQYCVATVSANFLYRRMLITVYIGQKEFHKMCKNVADNKMTVAIYTILKIVCEWVEGISCHVVF